MSKEAMTLALEALECSKGYVGCESWSPSMLRDVEEAIKALEEALKQEQRSVSEHTGEPVAWKTYTGRGYYIIDQTLEEAQNNWPDRTHQPLYTTPQPTQKPWVGLTNKELADCWDTIPERAIKQAEAKLKEKNT